VGQQKQREVTEGSTKGGGGTHPADRSERNEGDCGKGYQSKATTKVKHSVNSKPWVATRALYKGGERQCAAEEKNSTVGRGGFRENANPLSTRGGNPGRRGEEERKL